MKYFNAIKSIFLPFCSYCCKNYVLKYSLCSTCIAIFKFSLKKENDFYYFFDYKNENKKLILNYKKDGRKSLALLFTKEIIKILPEFDFDAIVTVPCSFKRHLFYGGDHMEYIGKILRKNGLNYLNIFKRAYGKSQKLLKGDSRLQNLENKIKIMSKYRNINLNKVVIIDDIITTGSSISVCEKLLYGNGTKNITKLLISKA